MICMHIQSHVCKYNSHAAATGWADLMPNICQQVLCTDLYTFLAGALVCKKWNNNIQGTGPRCMDFAEVQLRVEDKTRFHPAFILEKFTYHAPADLQELRMAPFADSNLQCAPALQQDFCVLAGSFPHLAVLELHFHAIEDWLPLRSLPCSLVSLTLAHLTGPSCREYNSLEIFNSFRKLEVLKLEFRNRSVFRDGDPLVYPPSGAQGAGRYAYAVVVTGQLELPSLRVLHLTAIDEKVSLLSERFLGIPTSCELRCNDLLGTLQIAACYRLQRTDIIGNSCRTGGCINTTYNAMRAIFYSRQDSQSLQLFDETNRVLSGRA